MTSSWPFPLHGMNFCGLHTAALRTNHLFLFSPNTPALSGPECCIRTVMLQGRLQSQQQSVP